eukprot:gene4447-7822_t
MNQGQELFDVWNKLSTELSLNKEEDEGKINPYYFNIDFKREKMRETLSKLKQNILKKEQKYLNLKEKKEYFIENKLDEITMKLRLGKFYELSKVVKHISDEMNMKFEEYHMIYKEEKIECYTFAVDIFTIDIHYNLNCIEKVIISGVSEDDSNNLNLISIRLTNLLKNEKYKEFELFLIKILKFELILKDYGGIEKLKLYLNNLKIEPIKSYFGFKIKNNDDLILSLTKKNNEIYFTLNFLNLKFIPFHVGQKIYNLLNNKMINNEFKFEKQKNDLNLNESSTYLIDKDIIKFISKIKNENMIRMDSIFIKNDNNLNNNILKILNILNDEDILNNLIKNIFNNSNNSSIKELDDDSFLIEVYLKKSKILLISFHYQIEIFKHSNDTLLNINFMNQNYKNNQKLNESLSKVLNESNSIQILIYFINKNVLKK